MYLFSEANITTFPLLVPSVAPSFNLNEGLSKNHASGWGLGAYWYVD